MCIFYIDKYEEMLYIDKDDSRLLSFTMKNIQINFVYKDKNLWFTKKELSNIFEVSKTDVKAQLIDISYDEVIIQGKIKKYYNLDKIIVLGYRLGKYKQVKTLNLLNRYVKVEFKNKHFFTRVKKSLHSNIEILSHLVHVS